MRRSAVRWFAQFSILVVALSTLTAPDNSQLPPSLVTALARDLHLTASQFMDRALTAQRLAAFQTTFPATTVWLDAAGRGVVLLPAGDGGGERDAADSAGFAVSDVAEPITVAAPTIPEILAAPFLPASAGSERIGGDPYAAIGGGRGLRCSFGFNGTDASGALVNISAGHCDPHSAAAGSATASGAFLLDGPAIGQHVGTFVRSNSRGHDYSIIRIDDAQRFRFEDNAIRVPAQLPLKITGTADPVVGAPVCKSGTTTGYTCGTVTAVNVRIPVADRDLTNAFTTNICALQGDSGGTLVTGTLALGIAGASNVGDFELCEFASIATFSAGKTTELYATPINVILADNPGIAIRTS